MIVNYRKREDRSKLGSFYEFDWEEGLITLYSLRYFPKLGKVYPNKAQNPYTKKYYLVYMLEPELVDKMLRECVAHPVMGQAEVVIKPLVKMVYYPDAFGPEWRVYKKHKELIDKNFDHWTANGMLIEER